MSAPGWATGAGHVALLPAGPADPARVADRLLIARYGWAYDERDHAALAGCFTPDGVWQGLLMGRDRIGPIHGATAIVDWLAGFWDSQTDQRTHVFTNLVRSEPEGNRASTHAYLGSQNEDTSVISAGPTGSPCAVTTPDGGSPRSPLDSTHRSEPTAGSQVPATRRLAARTALTGGADRSRPGDHRRRRGNRSDADPGRIGLSVGAGRRAVPGSRHVLARAPRRERSGGVAAKPPILRRRPRAAPRARRPSSDCQDDQARQGSIPATRSHTTRQVSDAWSSASGETADAW